MKYIKLYEAYKFDGSDMPFLNRDLISDLKDLCLDQLDNNYSLVINFFIIDKPNPIAYAIINHYKEGYNWYVRFSSPFINSDNYKIKYRWRLKKDRVAPHFFGQSSDIYDKESICEIDYRIRAMYPDEDIDILM